MKIRNFKILYIDFLITLSKLKQINSVEQLNFFQNKK